MREIKFRVWDTLTKIWVQPLSSAIIAYTDDLEYILDNRNNRLIFVFYTGLKDSKGVEIYEGDIVTPASRFSSASYEVYWDDRACQFRLCAHSDRQFDKTHLMDWANEVIGNMYENKELLK